jgi:signal peptidase I
MSNPSRAPRRVSAILLSLFVPGAGYFAIGRWLRGLVFSLLVSAILAVAAYGAAGGSISALWLSLALGAVLTIGGLVDVARIKRVAEELPPMSRVLLAAAALFIVGRVEGCSYRAEVLEAFKIPAGSMIPTLQVGDHLLVDKRARSVQRGDIIVFRYPPEPDKDFVKRVIGVGGDLVEVRDNVPFVNGQPIERRGVEGACEYQDYNEVADDWRTQRCLAFDETIDGHTYRVVHDVKEEPHSSRPFQVPPGAYWVLGDNRDNSHDSRFWGAVPAKNVKGTARAIWWARDLARVGQQVR